MKQIKILTYTLSFFGLAFLMGCGGGNNSGPAETVTTKNPQCIQTSVYITESKKWYLTSAKKVECDPLPGTKPVESHCPKGQKLVRVPHTPSCEGTNSCEVHTQLNEEYHKHAEQYEEVCTNETDQNILHIESDGGYYYYDFWALYSYYHEHYSSFSHESELSFSYFYNYQTSWSSNSSAWAFLPLAIYLFNKDR